MLKNCILAFLVAFILSVIGGLIAIPLLTRFKIGQPILKYVETHKDKNGTPTMGGLFFIMSASISFFIFCGFKGRIATVSVVIGLAFMFVGFIDDFIKIKLKRNEGLKPYQKILFQLAIAVTASFFAYFNGLTYIYLPFTRLNFNLGLFTIPLVTLIFIATTNSVNLTDGLDGLAGGTSTVYFIVLAILIYLQTTLVGGVGLVQGEYDKMVILCIALVGALLGFLLFNVNKAKVFMGDCGSLSLGGFIASLSIFSSNALYIAVIGFTFVFSSISVIIQVVYFKRTRKRVFLMTPFHHHLQLKGLTESKISYIYSLVTGILGVVCIICYL